MIRVPEPTEEIVIPGQIRIERNHSRTLITVSPRSKCAGAMIETLEGMVDERFFIQLASSHMFVYFGQHHDTKPLGKIIARTTLFLDAL